MALVGDGGFMLNVGELACAVQEKADLVVLLMNDSRYGVIKNIQDDLYGSRHAYVELHTPKFQDFCASLGAPYFKLADPAQSAARSTNCRKAANSAQGNACGNRAPLTDRPPLESSL